ncbi:hypothetical protein [Metabacillus halosaccharovorans]
MAYKSNEEIYDYEIMIDILAEMVTSYLTNQAKGEEFSEKTK